MKTTEQQATVVILFSVTKVHSRLQLGTGLLEMQGIRWQTPVLPSHTVERTRLAG